MISEVNDSEQGTLRGFRVLTPRISIAVLILVYLPLALTFSLVTRAWEADDELSHTQYTEYIVGHQALPHISAGWMRLALTGVIDLERVRMVILVR